MKSIFIADDENEKQAKREKRLMRLNMSLVVFLGFLGFVVLATASWLTRNMHDPWLSSFLANTACGGMTGIVLYILSNLRNNKQAILSHQFSAVSKALSDARDVAYMAQWYSKRSNLDIDADDLCGEMTTMFNKATAVYYAAMNFKSSLYMDLGYDEGFGYDEKEHLVDPTVFKERYENLEYPYGKEELDELQGIVQELSAHFKGFTDALRLVNNLRNKELESLLRNPF